MVESQQLSQDLQFVKDAMERSRAPAFTPPSMGLLWGTITLVGFSLGDFYPQYSGPDWAIAGPLGGVVSWMLGKRLSRMYGEMDRRQGMQELLHWSGMFVAILLLVFPARGIAPAAFGQLVLLIIAFGYYLAFVRRGGDWVILAASACMLGGYIALTFVHRYVWTLTGVCVFLAFTLGSFLASKRHE
jgi:hypothetical protein